MKPRRLVLGGLGVLVVLALVWTAWQAWQVSRSLTAAASDARSLQSSILDGDRAGADSSLGQLRTHATDADERTDGPTWSALTHLPFYGDDATGVRLVSSVLADLTDEGFGDLADTATDLDALLPREGQVPLEALAPLQDPVAAAQTSFSEANDRLAEQDSSGFAHPLKSRYDDLSDQVSSASSALTTANTALKILPGMLGDDTPRNYLLVFQNNAEVRATGGLPGAWALVHTEDGRISIEQQGAAVDFGERDEPILALTPEEEQLYGPQLGAFFQDANFTPQFPRSAQLWQAWWDLKFPQAPIDGVLSIDPVALSYLLESTGPVQVAGRALTPDNAVEELLNRPYIEGDAAAQDAFFAEAARSIFDAVTGNLQSPSAFLGGLQRGAREGRIYLASFDGAEKDQIVGTRLEGALPSDDDWHPRIQVTLNDATGSKMSYYLRYRADVEARSCQDNQQTLLGSMTLNQSIPAATAATLPDDITGGGLYGIEPGKQLVIIRIYGPTAGAVSDLRIDGKKIDSESVEVDGRPVVVAVTELSGPDDVIVTWSMTTGAGQRGDGVLGVTPGVTPGNKSSGFVTAC